MIALTFWRSYPKFPLCLTVDVAPWAELRHYSFRQCVCNSLKLPFMLQWLCWYVFSEVSYTTRKQRFPDGIFQSLKLICINSRRLPYRYYIPEMN